MRGEPARLAVEDRTRLWIDVILIEREVDRVARYFALELLVEQGKSVAEITAAGYDETLVRWILRRVELNEWKRHQAAPGLKVTSKAFGVGRRIPIVQKFKE